MGARTAAVAIMKLLDGMQTAKQLYKTSVYGKGGDVSLFIDHGVFGDVRARAEVGQAISKPPPHSTDWVRRRAGRSEGTDR